MGDKAHLCSSTVQSVFFSVIFCHLTWLLNKAGVAVLANALKGKHKCQSLRCLAKIWLHSQSPQRGDELYESHFGPLKRPTYQSILSNPHPGYSLVSRTHFYIYEITNSGL